MELRLPADAAYVGLARLVVVAAARDAGMDALRVEDLRIAVSEATANAVLARRRADPSSQVVLSFGTSDGGAFEVTIADAGLDSPEQHTDDSAPDPGLGLTLIEGLVDDVRFSPGSHSPTLTLAVGLGSLEAGIDGAGVREAQAPAR